MCVQLRNVIRERRREGVDAHSPFGHEARGEKISPAVIRKAECRGYFVFLASAAIEQGIASKRGIASKKISAETPL